MTCIRRWPGKDGETVYTCSKLCNNGLPPTTATFICSQGWLFYSDYNAHHLNASITVQSSFDIKLISPQKIRITYLKSSYEADCCGFQIDCNIKTRKRVTLSTQLRTGRRISVKFEMTGYSW